MHTIAIYFDEANRVYVFCSDGQERCRSDTRIRHLPHLKTLFFEPASDSSPGLHISLGLHNHKGRLKSFRRPLCAMHTSTLCLNKANRAYVGFQTASLTIQ